jgi:SOS-response transcriptional repressor LexA
MKGLTFRQKETLDFIASYISKHNLSPTYVDIMLGLNLKSKARVHGLVASLKERGYIDYSPRRGRSITILFSSEGVADWEGIARALFLQNRVLRNFVSIKGWEAQTPILELP